MLSKMFIVKYRIFSQCRSKISVNRYSTIHNMAMASASPNKKRIKSHPERLEALKDFFNIKGRNKKPKKSYQDIHQTLNVFCNNDESQETRRGPIRIESHPERLQALKDFCNIEEQNKNPNKFYQDIDQALKVFCNDAESLERRTTSKLRSQIQNLPKGITASSVTNRLLLIKQNANQSLQTRQLSTQNNSKLENKESAQKDDNNNFGLQQFLESDIEEGHEKPIKSCQEIHQDLKEVCNNKENQERTSKLRGRETVAVQNFPKGIKVSSMTNRLLLIKQNASQSHTQNNSKLENKESTQKDGNNNFELQPFVESDKPEKAAAISRTSRKSGGKKRNLPLEDNKVEQDNLNEASYEVKKEENGPCKKKFPFPKSVLNDYYQIVLEELKDKSIKPITTYTSNHYNNGKSVMWTCTYHLKWPVVTKVTAEHFTKKEAHHLAAQKLLQLLAENGKIAPDGSPLIHTHDEVRKLQKQKHTKIILQAEEVANLRNIINVFDAKMKHKVDSVDFVRCLNEFSKDLVKDEPIAGDQFAASPTFLGTAKYFAREKITLPISAYKEPFIQLLQNNNCVIVKGQPGCGKSSRIPQYVLESWIRQAGSGKEFCRIVVTQPRRIAAIALSERVASERNEELGRIIGYQVRLKSNFQAKTGRVLYCTTGILLKHLQSDPKLSRYSHVILDEAHERDVNTDLLMNLIKRALQQNDNLKLVVMSATIDTDAFSEYFNGAPIFSIPGFTYPVGVYFLNDLNCPKTLNMCRQEHPQVIHEEVVEVIKTIHRRKPEGAILVFLPGWEDLSRVQRLLNAKSDMLVHLVHSKLKDSEQHKIFYKPPPGIRKVILATNIAETSITIDDVVYVVDTGIHKDKIFDVDKGIDVIDLKWISKASADQRSGRAGRCSPGEAFRLYTREKYLELDDYTTPKILNSSLTKMVLNSKVFSNNMNACEFMETLITPPERTAVEKGVEELKDLELLDEQERLTPLGRTLVDFQLEPCLAKAMVNGVIFRCATPIVDIITLFSSDTDIFGSLGLLGKEMVKKNKSQFCKSSDHLAMMRIYEKWLELGENSHYEAQRFCENYNLVPHKLDFIKKLKDVHFEYLYKGLYESVPVSDVYSDNDELVKAVLYSGTGTVLEHRNWDMVKNRLKTGVNVLVTRNNHKATITGESVNFKRTKFPANFLVYINETRSNIRRTTTVRECSLIPGISVLLFNNKELEIIQPDQNNSIDENDVILGIKNTKLQFLCNKEHAEVLMNSKEAIQSSYKYLIHQLTYGGENISEFLQYWDEILNNLHTILSKNKVD